MTRKCVSKAPLSTFVVAAIVLAAMPVQASPPKYFPAEGIAHQYCPNDTVVFAGGDHCYMKDSPSCGKVHGFYARLADAKKAGMHPVPLGL